MLLVLRWVFFLRFPEHVAKADAERWYAGTHAAEARTLRNLRRYVSWRAKKAKVAPPWTTVDRLNWWDRVTELWFDDWAAWEDAAVTNVPAYTAPPYGWPGFHSETIFIEDGPGEVFLPGSPPAGAVTGPAGERLARWLFLLRYGENTTEEAGESWYLGTHTQEAKHMRGLARYVSWKASPRPADITGSMPSRWHRLTELAFEDMAAWEDGAVQNMPHWTPPPYGQPGFLSETVFTCEEPEFDFLRDV
ncbi:MAG: hypothetical protein L6Q80_13270 [Dehalococcoidia bacterium]|nr:hypothetical protein [Dehalococcoidia bacterium]